MKKYEAPKLTVNIFAADTMIASGIPKNNNAGNNQNCWACNTVFGKVEDGENACLGPNTPGC